MAYRRTERVLQRLAARHETIIAAARALASEQGMSGVQIVPVADRAGIAAGTVYRYFPAKSDLVKALVGAATEHDIAALRRAGDAAPGPLSALAAVVVALAARLTSHRRLAWAIFAEPVEEDIGAIRLTYRKALAKELESRVRATIAAGHLPEQDAELAAVALVGALAEGLVGPLAAEIGDSAAQKAAIQNAALFALRALGLVDARARGLVVQCSWPADEGLH
jgi:AcrR family transcriptional regulator